MSKVRITVTADPEVVAAGRAAAAGGSYGSVSDWANRAMVEKAERDRRLGLLTALIEEYEQVNGAISVEEMQAQAAIDAKAAARIAA